MAKTKQLDMGHIGRVSEFKKKQGGVSAACSLLLLASFTYIALGGNADCRRVAANSELN